MYFIYVSYNNPFFSNSFVGNESLIYIPLREISCFFLRIVLSPGPLGTIDTILFHPISVSSSSLSSCCGHFLPLDHSFLLPFTRNPLIFPLIISPHYTFLFENSLSLVGFNLFYPICLGFCQ